ncbi:MAG: tetratricopeptide repeat protein [Dehalococcoidia bacterium]|nr:tetratricopeptide repeat protein [Dehalococcoidia bacterium]
MRTFAELLTAYMDRTGIGDAELARRIPVNRLTLVRWKEGVTSRPRHRQDVVRCAELLRPTDEERDELLLAAGFSPDTAVTAPPAEAHGPHEAAPPHPSTRSLLRRRPLLTGLGSLLLLGAVGLAVGLILWPREGRVYPIAGDGESLVVLAPFVNYTAGGQGFNVVGRLKGAIDDELGEAGLSSVRTVQWPGEIDEEAAAQEASELSGAALVIWGEYDSGRVIARFTAPRQHTTARAQQVVDIASSPVDLPATININLTAEVRYVALVTLGQLYLEQEEFDRAKTVLVRASDSPPSGAEALANLRFLLGRSYMGGDLADFDEAIWLFTQVLAVRSRSVEALNSRALSYLDRGRPGDADLAVTDLVRAATISPERPATLLNLAVAYMERDSPGDADRAVASLDDAISEQPDYPSAYVNRAGAYLARGSAGDLDRAFQDLDTALELDPGLASAHLNRGNAYLARGDDQDPQRAIDEFSRAVELAPDFSHALFNRGLIHSELGDLARSLGDLQRAQEMGPRDPVYNGALCRQLAVAGRPEEALPSCDRAVFLAPEGIARDARGVANALLGREEQAIQDFRAFLVWLDASLDSGCADPYRQSRRDWVRALEAGDDPFSPMVLHELRVRPELPGGGLC